MDNYLLSGTPLSVGAKCTRNVLAKITSQIAGKDTSNALQVASGFLERQERSVTINGHRDAALPCPSRGQRGYEVLTASLKFSKIVSTLVAFSNEVAGDLFGSRRPYGQG